MVNTPLPPSQPANLQATAAYSGDRYGNTTASPLPSNTLHSVRKPPAKPWKKPAAAPPIPPRVFRVEPRGFRQLVQRLTGAPELAPRHLRDAAPVPLDVAPRQSAPPPWPLQQLAPPTPLPSTTECGRGFPAGEVTTAEPYTMGTPSPSLYSACMAWCNLPVLSPGSMASLEQSSVP
uniref:VQ domain-containing protein n=1 Tax=Anthurium amnicola TaxID=1678845 RepID=A0A1D1XZM1_9ARAE